MENYERIERKYRLKQFALKWARHVIQVSIAFIVSTAGLCLWVSPEGQKLDLMVLHYFFYFRGVRPPPADLVLVAVDDATYKQLDVSTRWPFPRHFYADGLEQIVKARPKVLIIDSRFLKEDVDPDADARIAAAFAAGPTTIWSGEIPLGLEGQTFSDGSSSVTQHSDQKFRDAVKMELPMLINESFGVSYGITASTKRDASLYERVPLARPLVELAKLDITAPGPVDLINFYGPAGTIKRIPFYQLVKEGGDIVRQQLHDKTVLLGYQSVGRGRGTMDKDEMNVSVSNDAMFGVEIHANIVGNLVEHSWLRRMSITTELGIMYIAFLWTAVAMLALTPERSMLVILGMLVVATLVCYFEFAFAQVWISGLGAFYAVGFLSIFANAVYHYLLIKSFREYIRKTFKIDFEREL